MRALVPHCGQALSATCARTPSLKSCLRQFARPHGGSRCWIQPWQLPLLASLGSTNREIAEALVVSAETVKTHVGNILTKLQLSHRTQVVIYALKRGLISLDEVSDITGP